MFNDEKLRSRHRDALLSEAAALGVIVRSAEEIQTGQHGAAGYARQLLQMTVLGEASTSMTSIDVYWMEGPIGNFLFAQPFQRGDALVGEYHVLLAGGLPQPVALCRALFFRKAWATGGDSSLSKMLEGSGELRAATKRLYWSKQSTIGDMKLEWTVQLSGLGDGTSHLVVQAGSSAFSIDDAMLGPFLGVVLALTPLMGADAPNQGRYFEPRFERLFFG